MTTHRSLAATLLAGAVASLAFAADGPLPMRTLAPDTTYLIVSADSWSATMESWGKTGLSALLKEEPLKGLMDDQGAHKAMEDRLKEIGAPADSLSWPDAFGMALFTTHNTELDTDEAEALFYGDWGARADAMGAFVEATLADAVKKDNWMVESDDEIGGRKVTKITIPPNKEELRMREQFGGMGVELASSNTTFFLMRDTSRFFVTSDRATLEDTVELVEGKRKTKLTEAKDYQGASDQLGSQDISVLLLTGPMQKAMEGEGTGMLAMFQPLIQPLFGDVQAFGFGLDVGSQRGQVELTQTIFIPGQKVGVWTLLGPGVGVEPPPAMIGPEAIGYWRMNVQFKEIMNLVNTVAANDPQMADMLDAWLLNFGPALSKGLEAMGPGVWGYSQVRQPITPESLVSGTLIACSNPKAVSPMLTQLGAPMGLEPRDVDGNTIFSSMEPPMSIGVSNGYMAFGDTKMVEQAMRSIGQKDLPSVAENAAFKRASGSVGSDAVIGWGYSDVVARWSFERELIKMSPEDGGLMAEVVTGSDDSAWAKRVGYQLPDDADEKMASLEPAVLAKHVGPFVWSAVSTGKGFVTRMWLMDPAPAAE